jgi:hypothetical protein
MRVRARTTRRGALRWITAGSIAAALPATAGLKKALAQTGGRRQVDLHLALAVDASGSVSQQRFELQRQGYAEAFLNVNVLQAIRSGPQAAIAVAMYQWTGPSMQAPVLAWRLVHDEPTIREVSAEIAASRRHLFGGGTSVSGAIDYGADLFAESPFAGGRRVIDVSGDGANNRGRSASIARDEAVARSININGLPILEVEPDLEEYYRNNVIGGPGAFVIAAETFSDFGKAILRKLILEIAGLQPGVRTKAA